MSSLSDNNSKAVEEREEKDIIEEVERVVWKKHPTLDLLVSKTGGRVKVRNTGRERKVCMGTNGYARISYRSKNYSVHRLVAQTYIENPRHVSDVNHIDGNRINNNASNLEWCTHKENIRKAYTETKTVDVHSRKIIQMTLESKQVREWNSIKEAAEHIGISATSISRAVRGRAKTAAKYKWRYKNNISRNTVVIETKTERKKGFHHPIIQIDNVGNEVEWKNAANAARAVRVDPSSIRRALQGKVETCRGYRWKYKDETINYTRRVVLPDGIRPIEGFPNYGVINSGDVYNVRTGGKLKIMKNCQMCRYVHLCRNGRKCTKYVGRLVIEAFEGITLSEKTHVIHINGDNSDDRLENLKYKINPTEKVQRLDGCGRIGEKYPLKV